MRFHHQLFLLSTAFAAYYHQNCFLFDELYNGNYIPGIKISSKQDAPVLAYYGSDTSKTNLPSRTADNLEDIFNDTFVDNNDFSSSIGVKYCSGKLLEAGLCQPNEGFLVDFEGHEDVKERTLNTILTGNEELFFKVEEIGIVCILTTSDIKYPHSLVVDVTHAHGFLPIELRRELKAVQISSFLTLLLAVYFIWKTKIYTLKRSEINHLPLNLIYFIIVNFISLQIKNIAYSLWNHHWIPFYGVLILKNLDVYFFNLFYYLTVYQYSINNSSWKETIKGLRWNKFRNTSIVEFSIGSITLIKEIFFKNSKYNMIYNLLSFMSSPIYIFYWFIFHSNFKETGKISRDAKLSSRLIRTSYVLLLTRAMLRVISTVSIFLISIIHFIGIASNKLDNEEDLESDDIFNGITSLNGEFKTVFLINMVQFTVPLTIGLLIVIWRRDLKPIDKSS